MGFVRNCTQHVPAAVSTAVVCASMTEACTTSTLSANASLTIVDLLLAGSSVAAAGKRLISKMGRCVETTKTCSFRFALLKFKSNTAMSLRRFFSESKKNNTKLN